MQTVRVRTWYSKFVLTDCESRAVEFPAIRACNQAHAYSSLTASYYTSYACRAAAILFTIHVLVVAAIKRNGTESQWLAPFNCLLCKRIDQIVRFTVKIGLADWWFVVRRPSKSRGSRDKTRGRLQLIAIANYCKLLQ